MIDSVPKERVVLAQIFTKFTRDATSRTMIHRFLKIVPSRNRHQVNRAPVERSLILMQIGPFLLQTNIRRGHQNSTASSGHGSAGTNHYQIPGLPSFTLSFIIYVKLCFFTISSVYYITSCAPRVLPHKNIA